ncbi:sushi domain protein [Dictyocaulus viviparus]|uniref:Sushi domain protein n=1 Tax=Dictyocaulus viviparus TaxID=29172 RepID=A0A0D8XRW5_DICVI|nr:sushi domain protein [Dictyocaulus viviparus]
MLTFDVFETEEYVDIVTVLDGGPSENSTTALGTFSGARNGKFEIISSTNMIVVLFRSDGDIQGRGFQAHWKAVPFSCGGVLTAQTFGQTFSSPHYPYKYPAGIECVWTVQAPKSQLVTLSVFDGSTKGRALHDGLGFNNEKRPPIQLMSLLGRFQILMQSNVVNQATGFNLTFSIDCPILKTPSLVSLSTKARTYGTKVDASCPPGFEFVSGRGRELNINCQIGGKWTENIIPDCQPVYCSAVPQIANGFAESATNVSFGGVAKYSCYQGFAFPSGNTIEEIHCGINGNWTNLPSCRAAVCSALMPFANGDRSLLFGDGTGYGTIFRFECRPGYRREGAATLLCKADGQWSFEQPKCVKLVCSSVPRIANGRLSYPQPFQFGDSAHVHCDIGFRAEGPEEVTCLANQSLSGIPSCRDIDECSEGSAVCQESSTRCINLPGGYTCQCLSGFQPQMGTFSIFFRYSLINKVLKVTVCSSPSALTISNLETSSEFLTPMELSAVGWCAAKSDPHKSIIIHFTAPKILEKIGFDKVAKGEVISIRIRYSQEEGRPLRELLIDGKNEYPVSNVSHSGEHVFDFPYSIESQILEITIASYRNEPCMKCGCNEGYDLFTEDGQGGVHLVDDETGEHPLDVVKYNRTCIPRSCPLIHSPENGKLLSILEEFHYPVVVQFQCDFGYQMIGPGFIQCLSDGSWNGTTPLCLPATCQGLKNNTAVGLFVSPGNNTIAYGHNVSIVCTQQNRPARVSPLASFRECLFDPQPDGREYWLSGPAADCPFVNCGPPPALAGAVYDGNHGNYNVEKAFNFFLKNLNLVLMIEIVIFTVGSVLTFTCRPPYSLVGKSSVGDKSVRCGVDASWDLGDLRCEGPVCVDPSFPSDGSVELNSVEEGAVARFSCNRKGYRPFPSESIQCMLGAACVLIEDVGISSGFIPDGAFADNSDSTNWGYEPHKARLSSTGWCGSKDSFIFLSVDLQRIYTLTTLRMAGVASSGYLRGHVTKMQLFYKTQFSHNYDTYPVEFETPSGNHNAMHQFDLTPPLRARYILLGVVEYEGNPCIRFDLLGCLAPMTVSHEVPPHLQIGWNGSVPVCMDAEPPSFPNCPISDIFAETDENGQIKPIQYEEPKAEDNSGRVVYVRIEPAGFSSGRLITSDIDVMYTAFDDAGNIAECVVKLRIPDTIPPVMKCPDSYTLSAFEPRLKVVFNLTTVPMVIQDVSNITEVVFNPSEAVLELGDFVEVDVTATDALANRNQCRFQVAYMRKTNSYVYLYLFDSHLHLNLSHVADYDAIEDLCC